ncbi:MAG TPA: MDR family MFS transporter [Xanthobacteraceae bacterium]|jgi:EmrB/QacA subfamily drug resistance transporter|uniref:MDR family MFS transporter n=1 Tax=Roseixanthobacter finlandensis TaxID=3119922 RepID=UPI000BD76755|nr:MAG: MFS transporter [Rhizobiales bacterium 39-66-18]HQS08952.1 MDR family MFS transporter [Xanthobacteraceae bacterium]
MSAPTEPSSPAPSPSAASLSHAEILTIIIGITLAMLLAALDQTIVATALPTIGSDLNDFANLSWVVTAYLLSSTAVTPLYGKLSDVFGRRVVLLFAIGVFMLGSLACALAPSMLALILARGLQGLGGGGLISLAQTIIADVVSPRERGRYQGYIASVFAASSIAGPVLGGVIADHLHWSLIFWINLPLGLAAFLMTERTLRRLPRHERRHKVDVLGGALMIAAATTLLLALTWGGVHYPWDSAPILGLFAAALVLSIAFVWRMRTAPEPFLPLSILANRVVSMSVSSVFFVAGIMIALSINVPLYFETVRLFTPSQSGLALIPQSAGVVLGATISGRAMARLTHYKLPAMIGLSISCACLVAFALLPDHVPTALLLVMLGLMGIGIGTVLPVSTVAIQNAVLPHQLGTATGTSNFFRALGAAIFVAMLGAVLLGALGVSQQGDIAMLVHDSDPAVLSHAFHLVFGAAAVAMLCGLGFLIAMEERPLRRTVRDAEEVPALAE